MSNSYRKFIEKFIDIPQHELQNAIRSGQMDGKNNRIEKESNELEGYIAEIISTFKSQWSKYKSSYQDQRSEIKTLKNSAEHSINQTIPDEIRSLEDKKNTQEDVFSTKYGRNSAEYEKLEEDLRNSRVDYDRIRSELNRPLLTKFEIFYLPFLLLLACAELPINLAAFELYFAGVPAVLLIIALSTGLILVFFAHTIGHLVKETFNSENHRTKLMPVLGIGMTSIVTFILIYILAVMRQGYANLTKGGDTFKGLNFFSDKVEVFQDTLLQPLSSEGISLFIINFVVFFAGILASYFRHDANPYYEKICKNFNKYREKMADKKNKIEKQLETIRKDHQKKLDAIEVRRQNLNKDIDQWNEELIQMDEGFKNDHKIILSNLDTLIQTYQSNYLENCEKTQKPKIFGPNLKKIIKNLETE